MLVNYGSYGLINFEAQKAIGLLQESFVFLDRLKENAQRAPSSLDFLPEEQREMLLHKDTDLATLYLRVLLADAYLCNQQHFEAAGELIRAEGMLDMAHLSGMWQVCPGTECLQPLNRAYVVEECEQFFKSFTNKDKALHEARAHSLRLHSKHAEPEELLHFTLLCARLHRKTENYPNAKKLFEKYLDALVEQNVEDHEYAMLELGRMMVYDMKKRKSGLVYLESATELMLADLLTYEQDGQTDTTAYKLLCVRCAGALLDVADVLEMNMDSNKALGVVQEAFELLLKSNNASMSAWVSLKYANLLSSLSMTDQAIETYLLTLETLSNPSLHVALGGRLEELSRANVEATLAHCYQVRVGDFRSACRHYKNVMDTADNGSPKRRARRIGKSATPPVVSTETVSFVLTNLVHCCERMGDSEAALDHQWRLFELGLSLGHCEPGVFMKLIDLANADEKLFSLCSELFVNIPMDELSPAVRLKLAETLTYCICKLGYLSTGNLFHKVVQQAYKSQNFMLSAAVHGDYGASDDTETSKTQFFAEQLKAMVLFTVEVFAVDLVVDGEENKARAAEGKPPQARDFEKEKMTLMVLNRVGLYFHANGFSEEAKELYELGLRHSESLGDGVKSTLYLREVGILSANYATLMYRQAPEVAEKYYDLGVKLCPEECSVQEVAGSFYTEQASVEKATTFARSLAAKFPDRSTVYYTNMAYMLINRFWDTLTPTQKLQTVCDTLLACNIAAARIPKVEEGVTDETLLDRVAEMEGLLLDAAVSCFTVDSATLLGYLFLGKFQELPRLTNKIFRECIRRFPNGSALLALYAPFCYQHGHIRLARMYYAKSYALEDGSDLRTNGYTVFLERMQHQIPLCEALVRCSLDRFPTAERHTAYAHFLSMHMPTPFKVDKYYTEAIALNPHGPQRVPPLRVLYLVDPRQRGGG
ncbi:hypothetical protein AGDE_11593 [Angomonas deanei]|uniref:Tetratricopeptide repeat n=1 Tax=Angomonas deanei TaxID=59799 RepID=A0A7G2C8V4_9TRYP|nr:hypothetical protein AGDE_11593 [Angomonas deanei]CAD2215471.1 hypothetical protein, conserved [Angomonas deanei]|eukprot:EPY25995.1 hypothetical protein AGDE_11593 [Angomonas deanei]